MTIPTIAESRCEKCGRQAHMMTGGNCRFFCYRHVPFESPSWQVRALLRRIWAILCAPVVYLWHSSKIRWTGDGRHVVTLSHEMRHLFIEPLIRPIFDASARAKFDSREGKSK